MSVGKRWHLSFFALGLSVFLYVAGALWSAVFIVVLPQSPDAFVAGNWEATEWVPSEFKNTFEEFKYYHNRKMRERNRYWGYGTLFFGALVGFLLFFVIPCWRETTTSGQDSGKTIAIAASVGVVAAVVPFLLSWVLPAPESWFPAQVRDVAERNEKEALSRLEREAEMFDAFLRSGVD